LKVSTEKKCLSKSWQDISGATPHPANEVAQETACLFSGMAHK
jgi:hypothetical protein